MEEERKAMDKLRDEMAKADAPGLSALGEYMTERLLRDGSIAPRVLKDGKTLAGAFEAIRAQAKKEQKGGFACIEDERAYRITCEYYGITPEPGKEKAAQALAPDALDLDALLDG